MKIINKYVYMLVVLFFILSLVACTGNQKLKEEDDNNQEIVNNIEQSQQNLSLENPEFKLLAYQLEAQIRSSFESAYQSWLNLRRITEYNDKNLEQIISVLHANLANFVVEGQIEKQVQKLKDIDKGGEGEISFPTHEVVKSIDIKEQNSNEVQVMINTTRYYPASEWAGKKYNKDFKYLVILSDDNNVWKVRKVDYQ